MDYTVHACKTVIKMMFFIVLCCLDPDLNYQRYACEILLTCLQLVATGLKFSLAASMDEREERERGEGGGREREDGEKGWSERSLLLHFKLIYRVGEQKKRRKEGKEEDGGREEEGGREEGKGRK